MISHPEHFFEAGWMYRHKEFRDTVMHIVKVMLREDWRVQCQITWYSNNTGKRIACDTVAIDPKSKSDWVRLSYPIQAVVQKSEINYFYPESPLPLGN